MQATPTRAHVLAQPSIPLRKLAHPILSCIPQLLCNFISETWLLYRDFLRRCTIPHYCMQSPAMRDCFTSNASSPFQLGYTTVWPVVNFPCMTHRLSFHPPLFPLPISKLHQRGKKSREGEMAMFLPRWTLHMPRLKSINGEGESLESALAKLPLCAGLDCRGTGQVLLLLAVTLPVLKHHIFWPLLTFWQLQKEAMTGANVWIWGTALKEFSCFAFHTANQINSSLSLMTYINMSFVYIPRKKCSSS